MKIAVIGQSLFGQEVYSQLRKEGHEIVGVFTVPDKNGKVDPLGEWEQRNGVSKKASCGGWEQSLQDLVVGLWVSFGQRQPHCSCSSANWLPGFSGTSGDLLLT